VSVKLLEPQEIAAPELASERPQGRWQARLNRILGFASSLNSQAPPRGA